MGEWKANVTMRIRPSSRDELLEFAVREQCSLWECGGSRSRMGTQATEDRRINRIIVEVRDSVSDRWVEATTGYLRRVAKRGLKNGRVEGSPQRTSPANSAG
jgi:hypothetical protein